MDLLSSWRGFSSLFRRFDLKGLWREEQSKIMISVVRCLRCSTKGCVNVEKVRVSNGKLGQDFCTVNEDTLTSTLGFVF